LPIAGYLKKIHGLKNKNLAVFSTTTLPPWFEWYVLTAYIFDYTTNSLIEAKKGKVIATLMLSSKIKRWGTKSSYGQKSLNDFCTKIETPLPSLQKFLLEKREVEEIRTVIVIFLTGLFLFLSFTYK
jgi:hypothetical protein